MGAEALPCVFLGPSKDQYIDRMGSGPFECASAFVQSGSRRIDIIHEENVLIIKEFHLGAEGILDVLQTFLSSEACLGLCVAGAAKPLFVQWAIYFGSQTDCEFLRLVEPAPRQASGM